VHFPDSQYDFLSGIFPPFKVPERYAPEGGGEPDCHALAGGYLIMSSILRDIFFTILLSVFRLVDLRLIMS
jgi:hypothetical protein